MTEFAYHETAVRYRMRFFCSQRCTHLCHYILMNKGLSDYIEALRKRCPQLTEEELKEAASRLERYWHLVLEIYESSRNRMLKPMDKGDVPGPQEKDCI